MAEKTNTPSTEVAPVEETVSKAEYDQLVAEYNRLSKAFNKALDFIANNYVDRIARDIFDAVDRESAQNK